MVGFQQFPLRCRRRSWHRQQRWRWILCKLRANKKRKN